MTFPLSNDSPACATCKRESHLECALCDGHLSKKETTITLPISQIHKLIEALELGIENTQEALSAHLNHYAPHCRVAKGERITTMYKEQESQINAAIELLSPYKEMK